ncbi:hypothetical protein JW758_01045 [Candidatus Peregrinibacteria bacterium]|nr:hypothetical protein [Candidatus Peregrinibacteria bacterium]
MKKNDDKIRGVAKIIMLAKNEDEVIGILHDLFTKSEIEKAHERVKIFACLKDGKSQRETKKESHAAIATVSHGAKFLKNSAVIIRQVIETAQNMEWWRSLFWRS